MINNVFDFDFNSYIVSNKRTNLFVSTWMWTQNPKAQAELHDVDEHNHVIRYERALL